MLLIGNVYLLVQPIFCVQMATIEKSKLLFLKETVFFFFFRDGNSYIKISGGVSYDLVLTWVDHVPPDGVCVCGSQQQNINFPFLGDS